MDRIPAQVRGRVKPQGDILGTGDAALLLFGRQDDYERIAIRVLAAHGYLRSVTTPPTYDYRLLRSDVEQFRQYVERRSYRNERQLRRRACHPGGHLCRGVMRRRVSIVSSHGP